MNIWIVAFAAALVVVIGFATGPIAVILSLIIFFVALYLLWAYQLGFSGARKKFDTTGFKPPLWNEENLALYASFFSDQTKVLKAGAIALGLTAAWLILPAGLFKLGLLALAVLAVIEVYRTDKAGVLKLFDTKKKAPN